MQPTAQASLAAPASSSAPRKKAKVQTASEPHDADALALAHLALIKPLLEKSTSKALKPITQDGSTFAQLLAALVERGFGTVQTFAALTKDDLAAITFLSPKAHAPILSVAKKAQKLKAPTEAHCPPASGAPTTREEQFEQEMLQAQYLDRQAARQREEADPDHQRCLREKAGILLSA